AGRGLLAGRRGVRGSGYRDRCEDLGGARPGRQADGQGDPGPAGNGQGPPVTDVEGLPTILAGGSSRGPPRPASRTRRPVVPRAGPSTARLMRRSTTPR